ncbi:putative cystathionine gamma-synthase [Haemophilus pittmaniae HK 85]|uniref:Putative cystathionine gamma-synthase n=1 Tax=Haemophilus pittmaniae HK 85 TaxID=1035188 RepID=F9QAB4_9PAST|nr:putative cystathionine gamma-synthase [Haemophilus pittmaniae HK 85]
MTLFTAPDEWIVGSDVYGGTYRLLDFAYKIIMALNRFM